MALTILPTINGYTIDLRLKEARMFDPEGGIEIHDIARPDSEKAQQIRDEVLAFCYAALMTLT